MKLTEFDRAKLAKIGVTLNELAREIRHIGEPFENELRPMSFEEKRSDYGNYIIDITIAMETADLQILDAVQTIREFVEAEQEMEKEAG